MFKRSMLILMLLVMTPATLLARFQDDHAGQKKSLRVLVEGDSSTLPHAVEELRKAGRDYGLEFVFAAATDPYDARLIFTTGAGTAWNPDPHPTFNVISYGYSSAVALTPEGKLLFTASNSGVTMNAARTASVKDMIKNLSLRYDALTQKATPSNAGNIGGGQSPEGLSDQPGVYYKSPSGWARLDQTSPSGAKARGLAKAMFSWGFASISAAQVYQGAQASLQLSERRPVFYVKDFAVSEQGATIVRVEKKGGSREVQVGSVSAFNARPGFRDRDRREVKVSRAAGGVSVITPAADLEPGEYLLLLDSSDLDYGYDFGVKTAKQ
jgi:hypothetical protein